MSCNQAAAVIRSACSPRMSAEARGLRGDALAVCPTARQLFFEQFAGHLLGPINDVAHGFDARGASPDRETRPGTSCDVLCVPGTSLRTNQPLP